MLEDSQDAFGHEIYDYFKSDNELQEFVEIVERDDGYIGISPGVRAYFSEYQNWSSYEKKALEYVRGRVLDVGCGAGRHALYLQKRGFEVLGIDNSNLAIEVCKQRGLRNTEVMSISQINSRMGIFDTVLMMGNNFGLFGSSEGARKLLRKFNKITSENGRIIAVTNDVYKTDTPEHLSYHELNRKGGRMPGQIRLRIRYKKYATPWFDYLMVSKDEMKDILSGTYWRVNKFIDSSGSVYAAIIDKKK